MYGAVLGWKITDKIAARMEQMCGIRILHPRCMFCAKKCALLNRVSFSVRS